MRVCLIFVLPNKVVLFVTLAQVEELESTVSELEEALQRQQVEASDAVEQWSTRWSELDSLKSDLERHLETISKERDDLSEMLQHERENSGKEALAKIESDHDKERAEWVAEKDRLQARIDEQNEDILVSSQNAAEANEELSRMRATAEETVEAWKRKLISVLVIRSHGYAVNLNMHLLIRRSYV